MFVTLHHTRKHETGKYDAHVREQSWTSQEQQIWKQHRSKCARAKKARKRGDRNRGPRRERSAGARRHRNEGAGESGDHLKVKPTKHLQLALPHKKYAHSLFLQETALK